MNDAKIITLSEFLKRMPPVTFIGVVGVCGKTTTCSMIEHICKSAKETLGNKFVSIDLEKPELFVDYLKEMKRDGLVLTKIPLKILNEVVETGLIPAIAVFTYLEDAEAYAPIFKSMTYTNYIIGTDEVIDIIKKDTHAPIRAKMLRTSINVLPKGAKLSDFPYHVREDASLAVRVAEIFEIPNAVVAKAISEFKGLEGRVEYIKKVKEVAYLNDAHSEHFASLKTALASVAQYKNTVLILGGNGTESDMGNDIDKIAQYCHTFVVIPGTGTQKAYKHILKRDDIVTIYSNSIEEAVVKAGERAGKGDVVVYSPGFFPTLWCGNREERSRRFVEAVRKL
ncbi:MAG: cyanophycin synthetase [bacterium]